MYLPVTSSAIQATDLKLSFSLTSDATVRKSWNIKIALLPCGVNYLGIIINYFSSWMLTNYADAVTFKLKIAPENCLQYFTTPTGQIKSFNWKDNPALVDPTVTAPTRHLANQKQLSCIRVQSVKYLVLITITFINLIYYNRRIRCEIATPLALTRHSVWVRVAQTVTLN